MIVFNPIFTDPLDMYEEDEERIYHMFFARKDETSQIRNVTKSSTKMAKEPPIVINLRGVKFEVEE